jgi:C4-dicarboxylate-specific signal transduction histidine kinase
MRSFYKKSPSQRESVDVNRILQEILTLLDSEATRSSVAVRTELAADVPKIMADRVQLQQVFMNLMLNGHGGLRGRACCEVATAGRSTPVLRDMGVGLPTEKMEQIFSAFHTTKPQGSGMGLAISRSIVESHGGRLWGDCQQWTRRNLSFHHADPDDGKCDFRKRSLNAHMKSTGLNFRRSGIHSGVLPIASKSSSWACK